MKLHLSSDVQESFSYAADWVERTTPRSIQSKNISAIVLPHPEVAIQLRKTLAARGGSFLNIHFWTPEQLRSHLLRVEAQAGDFSPPAIASREELHLVLSSVASVFSENKNLLAHAVKGNPASLLRILDMLDAASLQADRFESLSEVAPLAQAFYATLESQGLRTVSAMDRFLNSSKLITQFGSLLIFGFHGGHWPLFPLLTTATRLAENPEVILDAPRDASFDLDSSWVGNWEETFGTAAVCLENQAPEEPQKLPVVEFLAAESLYELAGAIAHRAAELIGEGAPSLAVVFSSYGSLSREVALALNELKIPHYDAIGHKCLQDRQAPPWRNWCAFQKAQTVQKFADFLTLLPEEDGLAELLLKASRETLSQDILICREFVRAQEDQDRLAAYALLPERGSFAEFCESVWREFMRIGWHDQVRCLRERQERFHQAAALRVERDFFLRWLQAALSKERRRRDPEGAHPYAPIQLLRRDQASLCPWTHVILAGMNMGEWPEPPEENGFLSADVIADLNRQINAGNTQNQITGSFGEGHFTVSRIPCLGPRERHLLQKRDFQALRASSYLLATTQLKKPNEASARPSFWFSELFHELHGRSPSLTDLRVLVPATRQEGLLKEVEEVVAMRRARLDAAAPFSSWEFVAGFPPRPLAVVDVERMLTEPAAVWMKVFLGVESPESRQMAAWGATVGTWTHRWLRSIFQGSCFPDQESRKKAIAAASATAWKSMERACQTFQRPIPEWWASLWRQARSMALQLSEQLETYRSQFSFAATETSFQNVYVPPLESLVCGRWDLVLCTQALGNEPSQPFAGSSILVIDYKTGKAVRTGMGLQLALYAHAALAWGAQSVDTTWLTPHTAGEKIHLPFEELEKTESILSAIGRMLRTGAFGMKGELRSEFSFHSPMPLATLLIPQTVLQAKWKLTHDFE